MSSSKALLPNLIWKFLERGVAQLISFVVSIVLARILMPADYGLVAVVMIFISLAAVFVNCGLGSSLIQKKEATALDFFSVLYFSLASATVLYAVLFFTAPLIVRIYGNEYVVLTPVLRVLGLQLIIGAVSSVQGAYVSRGMMFNKVFVVTLWTSGVSAVVGISMAYCGFGVWALVAQSLLASLTACLVMAIMLRKRPQLMFSWDALGKLAPYGLRILGSNLLVTGFLELRALIIGKLYSPADLAFFDRGRTLPHLLVNNVNNSFAAVLFPKMASQQDDLSSVKETMRMSIRFSAYLMSAPMFGLAAIATPLVSLLLTDKWLPCVPILQVFCIIYLFFPMHTANVQAIAAMGRSDICLRLEFIKKSIEIVVLLGTMWYGVTAIVIGVAACSISFTFLNAYPNIKLLNYSFKEQMLDILPSLGMGVMMFGGVYAIGFIPMGNNLALISIQILAGAAIYIGLSVLMRNKELVYIKNKLSELITK